MALSGTPIKSTQFKLPNAPIVEAVLDLDCDMPPAFDLAAFEVKMRDAFRDQYPKFRAQYLEKYRIEWQEDQASKHSAKRAIQGFQFLQDDEKQLVQVRAQGFSFNRLAPYSTLDEYLPEIERTWSLFVTIASPVQIRVVRLRYINRILLPFANDRIELQRYLKVSPKFPAEERLQFAGFLNQHAAVEVGTGHQANIVLTSQPRENDNLPVILDICVASEEITTPENWAWILAKIQSLRDLKNVIFRSTVTEQCLTLFQQR